MYRIYFLERSPLPRPPFRFQFQFQFVLRSFYRSMLQVGFYLFEVFSIKNLPGLGVCRFFFFVFHLTVFAVCGSLVEACPLSTGFFLCLSLICLPHGSEHIFLCLQTLLT